MHRPRWHVDSQSANGSAMIAVIGVMAVLAVVAITVSAVSINALGQTTSSRADLQSAAAAESAINFGRSEIARGASPCSIDWTAAPGPSPISATVQQSIDGITWGSCPATPTTKFMRIVATGNAIAKGVAGVSAGDVTTVSALYDYKPGIGPVESTGAGIYAYNTFAVDKGTLTVDPVTITGGGAIVRNGDFVCTNPNGVVTGSIWVYGNLDLGKCEVTGNVWVSGNATMESSSNVTGTVCSSTGVAKACPAGWTMPTSPDWVDIKYEPAKWVHTDGLPYEVVIVPVGSCNIDQVLDVGSARSAASAGSRPVIINSIDNCPDGIQVSGSMTIRREVVLFARSFVINANNSTFTSPDLRRLWFMTPDYVDDAAPSCPGYTAPAYADGKKFEFGMGWVGNSNHSLAITGGIRAMLYTPCGLSLKNNSEWTGQLYVGGTDVQNNFNFKNSQVGIGGANLNTGLEHSVTTPSVTLKSIRDIKAGG